MKIVRKTNICVFFFFSKKKTFFSVDMQNRSLDLSKKKGITIAIKIPNLEKRRTKKMTQRKLYLSGRQE